MGCNAVLSDNEDLICTSCRHKLPVTNFHLNHDTSIEKIFYGRVQIENATALMRFQKKGIVQNLLHNLKYRKQENIGKSLGAWLGHELKSIDKYQSINAVIPVPIHKRKLRKRGYNQVSKFGLEIASILKTDYFDDVLIKTSSTKTQVFKKRLSRWQDSNDILSLKNEHKISGKHILLVDDIITTGATIEACSNVLQQANDIKISIATMAIAE